MPLDILTIRDALVSHAMTLGVFDTVNAHQPDAIPGQGLHCAFEFDRMSPARSSGLSSTSMTVVFTASAYASLTQEPADDIDALVVGAADVLLAAYVGDFTLGGLVRMVDVRGSEQGGGGSGAGLVARGGYARVADQDVRVVVITVPLIVNDIYPEAP